MRLGLILASALLGGFVVSGTTGAATRRESCHTTKTTTIARNAQVRVYRRADGGVFACYVRDRRALFLGHSGYTFASDYRSLSVIRLAGRFVAFDDVVGCDRHTGDCSASVKVVDVRTGRRRHVLSVGDTRIAGDPPSQAPYVSDLALTRTGSAAVIIGPTESREVEVWRLDSHGKARLDQGADVERGSLAVSRRWVYWRRGGQASSAALR